MIRLTIIRENGFVSINDVGYDQIAMDSLAPNVRAVQWYGDKGDVEFFEVDGVKPPNQEITAIDQFQFVIDGWDAKDYAAKHPPAPTPPSAEYNKQIASQKLYETDWTTISDVTDPTKSNPYLVNSDEFIAYRNAIRQYAVNPVEGFIDWAVKPVAVWSTN